MPAATTRPAWSYGALDDYRAPQGPDAESLSTRLKTSWRRWRESLRVDREEAKALDRLQSERIASLIPDPEWPEALAGLAAELEGGTASQGAPGALPHAVVVGPPGSLVSELLERWAESRGHPTLPAPAPASLLEDQVRSVLEGSGPETLVLPALHDFHLRHPAGIAALRALIEEIRGRDGRLVIGCDSWAWAFLCRSTHLNAALPPPLAPAPLSGSHLQEWLAGLCEANDACPYEFRFAESGSQVAWGPSSNAEAECQETRLFFDRLAARSRGIPSVALALWRNALRHAREGDSDGEAQARGSRPVWVQPASEWELPHLPVELERLDAIVLHTLLLHAGLPESLLHRLLPFDAPRVTGSLLALHGMGVAEEREGFWSVPSLAYPNVRAFLRLEGFLVDAF